jgi:hypothetical protein
LFEPFGDEMSFIPIEGTIYLVFYFEYPFAINDVMTLLRRDKVPCTVPHKGTVLIMHRRFPVRSGESFLEIEGFTGDGKITISNGAVRELFGFLMAYAPLKTSLMRQNN